MFEMENLEPGRELDRLIEARVMRTGSVRVSDCGVYASNGTYYEPGPYSTDMYAAFEVVQKVMKNYKAKISIETYDAEIWSIKPCGTSSKSLPHAICLAALKAVESSTTTKE